METNLAQHCVVITINFCSGINIGNDSNGKSYKLVFFDGVIKVIEGRAINVAVECSKALGKVSPVSLIQ